MDLHGAHHLVLFHVYNIIIIESGSINMRELLDSKKYKHQI